MIPELLITAALAAVPATERHTVIGAVQADFPVPTDDVRLAVNAHTDGTRAWGNVLLYHYFSNNGVAVWLTGTVDCLTVSGGSAKLTVLIGDTHPELAGWRGMRMGFGIATGGTTNVGTNHPAPPAQLPECTAPEPDTGVRQGGFLVR